MNKRDNTSISERDCDCRLWGSNLGEVSIKREFGAGYKLEVISLLILLSVAFPSRWSNFVSPHQCS
jgi:hypothetical protein